MQTVIEQLVEAAENLARKVGERDPFLFAVDGAEVSVLATLVRADLGLPPALEVVLAELGQARREEGERVRDGK